MSSRPARLHAFELPGLLSRPRPPQPDRDGPWRGRAPWRAQGDVRPQHASGPVLRPRDRQRGGARKRARRARISCRGHEPDGLRAAVGIPHGAHINVHGGAKSGGAGWLSSGARAACRRAARNLITVENDEVSFGLDDLLPARRGPSDRARHPPPLDRQRAGNTSEPAILASRAIVESWRGVRPRRPCQRLPGNLLAGHDPRIRPDFSAPPGRRDQAEGPARPLRSHVERGRQRPRRRAPGLGGFRGRGQTQEPRLRGPRPAVSSTNGGTVAANAPCWRERDRACGTGPRS